MLGETVSVNAKLPEALDAKVGLRNAVEDEPDVAAD